MAGRTSAHQGLRRRAMPRPCRWLLALAALGLVGRAASAQTPPPAPTADPITVVRAFFDAVNRNDPVAAAALFADDAVYVAFWRTG